jgi:hypothetical protein
MIINGIVVVLKSKEGGHPWTYGRRRRVFYILETRLQSGLSGFVLYSLHTLFLVSLFLVSFFRTGIFHKYSRTFKIEK